ncbi:MAG: ATP-dependent Clp protease proteolytic subunit [Treponema sp.]
MAETYIRLLAPINQNSAGSLFHAVDTAMKAGTERIHLFISSPGGDVAQGISIYNYLKLLPAEVYTYNFGSVDSIGVIIFCAGTKRLSVPHARFLIHGVQMNLQGQGIISLDEKQLEEMLKGLKIDQENIARIISDATGKSVDQIQDVMNARTTLTPDQAKGFGLVQEFTTEKIPAGTNVISITAENGMPFQIPGPMPIQIPMQLPPRMQRIVSENK